MPRSGGIAFLPIHCQLSTRRPVFVVEQISISISLSSQSACKSRIGSDRASQNQASATSKSQQPGLHRQLPCLIPRVEIVTSNTWLI